METWYSVLVLKFFIFQNQHCVVEEKVAPPAETVNPEEVQKEATETEGAHGETPEESPLAEKPSPSEEAPAVAVEGEEEPPPAAEGEPEAERTAGMS